MAPSAPNADSRTTDDPSSHWPAFAALLLAFGLAALLGSASLVEAAGHQAYGPRRDGMLTLTTGLHQAARRAGLDRPAIGLAALRAGDFGSIRLASSRPVVAAERGEGRGDAPAFAIREPAYLPFATRGQPVPARASTTADEGLRRIGPRQAHSIASNPTSAMPTSLHSASRRRPSTVVPLRLHVAGDSFAEPLGLELQRIQALGLPIEVSMEGRIATALTRPDYFDWPARLSETMAEAAALVDMEAFGASTISPVSAERASASAAVPSGPIEVLLLVFAGNEGQNMFVDGQLLEAGSPEWAREYQRRAAGIMDAAGRARVELRWIGLPPMRDEPLASAARAINEVLRQAAADRPWVQIVETESMFSGPDGGYAFELPDERGEPYAARKRDGVHWTRPASDRVAALALAGVAEDWGFAESEEAPSTPLGGREPMSR